MNNRRSGWGGEPAGAGKMLDVSSETGGFAGLGLKSLRPVSRRRRPLKKKTRTTPRDTPRSLLDLLLTFAGACRSCELLYYRDFVSAVRGGFIDGVMIIKPARGIALNANTIYSVISNLCLIKHRVYLLVR